MCGVPLASQVQCVQPLLTSVRVVGVCKIPHFSDKRVAFVQKITQISDMNATTRSPELRLRILASIASSPGTVWTPADFAYLGSRAAVDKTLQRLVASDFLRRIDRGLYDQPSTNRLTHRATVPDYREVIRAVTRRSHARYVVDGMTAANDLGLTTAVPARIEVLTDARFKPVRLGNQDIHFRQAAASRLFWADRPAMRVVQALHWLHDVLSSDLEARTHTVEVLRRIMGDPKFGEAIRSDLSDGWSALPIWMQAFLRDLVTPSDRNDKQ